MTPPNEKTCLATLKRKLELRKYVCMDVAGFMETPGSRLSVKLAPAHPFYRYPLNIDVAYLILWHENYDAPLELRAQGRYWSSLVKLAGNASSLYFKTPAKLLNCLESSVAIAAARDALGERFKNA